MKCTVVALALSSNGCAFLFQEHLPARYNHRAEEPRCSASYGLAVIDSVLSGLSVALAVGATDIDTSGDPNAKKQRDIYVASSLLGGVIHAVSAGAGFHWADACEQARIERAAYMQKRLDGGHPSPRERRPLFRRRDDTPPMFGNGFFCSSISCSRDLETCQNSRLPDEQPCAAQSTAFCFGNARFRVCRPTMPACERQLEVSGYGSTTNCQETR